MASEWGGSIVGTDGLGHALRGRHNPYLEGVALQRHGPGFRKLLDITQVNEERHDSMTGGAFVHRPKYRDIHGVRHLPSPTLPYLSARSQTSTHPLWNVTLTEHSSKHKLFLLALSSMKTIR